jgi:transcription elongation GreA/GreB family factor
LADGSVQVVTPRSPLGQALVGKRAGDECLVVVAGRERALTVLSVA